MNRAQKREAIKTMFQRVGEELAELLSDEDDDGGRLVIEPTESKTRIRAKKLPRRRPAASSAELPKVSDLAQQRADRMLERRGLVRPKSE